MFRFIVKAAHLRESSVELDLYVNPQNYQWKYRKQQKPSAPRAGFLESLQVQVPIVTNPDAKSVLTAF